MKKLFILAVLFVTVLSASAQEVVFSYDTGDVGYTSMGTGKNEVYNVAIHLNDKNLVGTTITGARVPFFAGSANIKETQFWLTKELTVENSADNAPDICTQEASFTTRDERIWLTVTFDKPYTITEDGVYVGYSFRTQYAVATGTTPVTLAQCNADGGFYLMTSRTYKRRFQNQYGVTDGVAAIEVLLTGVKENSVALQTENPEITTLIGQALPYSFSIVNLGSAGIQSVDYTIEYNGARIEQQFVPEKPIPGRINKRADVQINLPSVEASGTYPLIIRVTKVNGEAVTEADVPILTSVITAVKTYPKHRAVLEEYTGTWCGWCPRGFVGLEEMGRKFPEDFIGISYHNGDPMEIMPVSSFPSAVSGFPAAWLDRVKETDAYLGDNTNAPLALKVDRTWKGRCEVPAPAQVDVEASWSADKQSIDIKATVAFLASNAENPYLLSYILTADGLTGKSQDWYQANYYSGQSASWNAEDMKQFTQGGSLVALTYNDVAVYWSGKNPLRGSLPAAVVAEEPMTHSYNITASRVVNTDGTNLIQDPTKLKAIVLLIDTRDGSIANANKASVTGWETGIGRIESTSKSTSSPVFDLQGRRVQTTSRGIFITDGKKMIR